MAKTRFTSPLILPTEVAPSPLQTWEGMAASAPTLNEQILDLSRGELFQRAVADLRGYLKSKNTNPSEDEWKGLEQIVLAIEGMADGTIPNNFHVSSLACGVGKSSAVSCTIREMMVMDSYQATGVIVFLSRCEEIERFVKDMGLKDEDYKPMVSENGQYAYLNELGNPDPKKARILFTTQQRLRMYLEEREKFADISEFHYCNAPRQVRVWDEAILPSNAITLPASKIRDVLGCIERNNKEIENHLYALYDMLRDIKLEGGRFEGFVIDPAI